MRRLLLITFLVILTINIVLFVGCGNDDDDDDDILTQEANIAYIVNGLAQTISTFNIETKEMKNDVLSVGKWPNGIEIKGDRGYVINTGDNSIQVIDLNNNSTIGTIPVGDGTSPEKLDFINENEAYVTCNWTNSVKRIALSSMSAETEIKVGTAPWGIVVANNKAYVCNTNVIYGDTTIYEQGTVSVIDTSTNSVIETIEVGINPTEITTDQNGKVLVVCTGNYADIMGEIYIIDPSNDQVIEKISLNITPGQIAVSPSGTAYLTGFMGLTVLVLSTRAVSQPLTEYAGGDGLTIDDDGNVYICVPDWQGNGGDKLMIIDPNQNQIGNYQAGGGAQFVAIKSGN